jgi:hypothetical protein
LPQSFGVVQQGCGAIVRQQPGLHLRGVKPLSGDFDSLPASLSQGQAIVPLKQQKNVRRTFLRILVVVREVIRNLIGHGEVRRNAMRCWQIIRMAGKEQWKLQSETEQGRGLSDGLLLIETHRVLLLALPQALGRLPMDDLTRSLVNEPQGCAKYTG